VLGYANSNGYLVVTFDGRQQGAHRIAWKLMVGEYPVGALDHINGDKHDNRWANLREASTSENACNARTPRNNTSGFKGVGTKTGTVKFRACLRYRGKQIHIGYFDTVEAARAAVIARREEVHGSFARA
jgi:hypothetical protein